MMQEAKRLSEQRNTRKARVKRILRRMPRRTNMHRYPVLKWFGSLTRKRPEIWSFRVKRVVPALYAGFIIALMPLYGVQLPLSVLIAWVIRANLPVLFSLQLISNPLTILPVYFSCFQVGRIVLNLFGMEMSGISLQEMNAIILQVSDGNFYHRLHYLWRIWWVTSLGGLILGTFFASISAGIYKLAAYEVTLSYQKLKDLQCRAHAAQQADQSKDLKTS